MFQSIEVPLANNDAATLSGNLSVSNGQGNGRFTLSGRRVLSSKGWIELDVGAGNGVVLGGKGLRNFGKRFFVNGQVNLNVRQNGVVPSLVGSLAIQLDRHTVGYLTYTAAGLSSSLSTVIERNSEKNYVNLTFSLGLPHSFVACNYVRRMAQYEAKLKLAGKVGTFGFQTEYGIEKKVSKYSSVHASVMVGVPNGVVLKIRFMRSSQSYNFFIQLSEEIIPAAVFYATAVPIVSYFILKKCILEPLDAENHKRVVEKKKEMNEQKVQQKRKEAEAAVSLMQAQYERICSEEEARDGLLILFAYYGKFDDEDNNTPLDSITLDESSSFIDVKVPLQCLVKDGEITIHTTVKVSRVQIFILRKKTNDLLLPV
jgi:DnaJ family protein C protein 11